MEKNLKQKQSAIVKIALFGPESTGKTTLAKQLAAHYDTVWTPEFARDYLQEKWDKEQKICDVNDMLPIAYGQVKLENENLAVANKYLFCDTNLLVTKVFSEMYYNYCDPLLAKAAQEHEYDLFFLTDIDVPWEKDDIRDKSEGRESVFEIFKQSLISNKKPFITLSGNRELRLKKAVRIIEDLAKAKTLGFTSMDFVQIYNHGISLEAIQKQVEFCKNGISKTDLVEAAVVNNGILKLSKNDLEAKAAIFDSNKQELKLLKFVPASGAATRMFKFLIAFLEEFDIENDTINGYINRKSDSDLAMFIIAKDKFPFFDAINEKLEVEFPDYETLSEDFINYHFINYLLSSAHYDFGNKPKGILQFHQYENKIATPIEEHLYECSMYASSKENSHLHFTVSEIHQQQFENIISSIKQKVEEESSISIEVSYSYQDKSTDSLTVDSNNNIFRDKNDKLVFRPGGHGALIKNLGTLDADVIFIKNIDNVTLKSKRKSALCKKALAGILIELQQQIFSYLRLFDAKVLDNEELDGITKFLNTKLNIQIPSDFDAWKVEDKTAFFKEVLNRPIRVCGMVKNEGEPGGGPFWVRNNERSISLQIVESSQVDLSNQEQNNILNSATHFNPVDLVCGIKNYKKEQFDLDQFVDNDSGFIVEKTVAGKNIKAYELPGLWNGAMAKWLTIFVEVPLFTFNPVKTVNDLLKPAHQNSNLK